MTSPQVEGRLQAEIPGPENLSVQLHLGEESELVVREWGFYVKGSLAHVMKAFEQELKTKLRP